MCFIANNIALLENVLRELSLLNRTRPIIKEENKKILDILFAVLATSCTKTTILDLMNVVLCHPFAKTTVLFNELLKRLEQIDSSVWIKNFIAENKSSLTILGTEYVLKCEHEILHCETLDYVVCQNIESFIKELIIFAKSFTKTKFFVVKIENGTHLTPIFSRKNESNELQLFVTDCIGMNTNPIYPLALIWYLQKWKMKGVRIFFHIPYRLHGNMGCPVFCVKDFFAFLPYQDLFSFAIQQSFTIDFPYCWLNKLSNCTSLEDKGELMKSLMKSKSWLNSSMETLMLESIEGIVRLRQKDQSEPNPVFGFNYLPPEFMVGAQSMSQVYSYCQEKRVRSISRSRERLAHLNQEFRDNVFWECANVQSKKINFYIEHWRLRYLYWILKIT